MRKDEIGDEMYVICKGTVEVCSKDGKTIYKTLHVNIKYCFFRVIILKEGDFFGELALITSQPRSASVRAVNHCDLFMLRYQLLVALNNWHNLDGKTF